MIKTKSIVIKNIYIKMTHDYILKKKKRVTPKLDKETGDNSKSIFHQLNLIYILGKKNSIEHLPIFQVIWAMNGRKLSNPHQN